MKYSLITLIVITLLSLNISQAQRYLTKTGYIRFFSQAPIENIEAHNRQVASALDVSTGDFVFKVLIKSFQFEKALMQEHFNENYMESDKYPNSTFNGNIKDIKNINTKKNGIYNIIAEGTLTIRDVSKKIKAPGTIEVKDGKLLAKAKFAVAVADYNITIPKAVANNIAKEIDIFVDVVLEASKK